MAAIDEFLSERFRRWEERGRGWQMFDQPVWPEPPFIPFPGNHPPPTAVDDGRRPTALSAFVQRLSRTLAPDPAPLPQETAAPEPEPDVLEREPPVELQVSLPRDFDPPRFAFPQFLQSVSFCREPLAFELLGVPGRITAQLAVATDDLSRVRKQMEAAFPGLTLVPQTGRLANEWNASDDGGTAMVEFGLAREFPFPLASAKIDPFTGITAALAELQPGELGLFQVIFQPVRHPWGEHIVRAVTDAQGKPFFQNAPELTKAAEAKAALPLYAAVVRIATRAADFDRAWEIARDLASSLRVYADPCGNELIPLRNDQYPFEAHIEDVLLRQTRRSGMILTSEELVGFVHLPSLDVPGLSRESAKTKAAPLSAGPGTLLGHNPHAGETRPVYLSHDQRVCHTHLIGASGTGKSTLLYNLIRQDIEHGEGVAVLDPHGDLIDRLLSCIPPERINDVVLIDPSDEQYSVGFNILSAHSDLEKNLLASDLVSVFQRLSTSWGDQMGSVLQNAILAFLESSRGGTLADLRRFLLEPDFRNDFLSTVRDPDIVYYWRKGFAQLSGNKSIGPVLTRLETFLAPKPIRYMVSQPENRLDFADILDTGKIFLAKLPQGLMGKENSFLLGSLLVAKFQQTAMSRQAQQASTRRDFFLYADEFQNFITPSMAEILTGARKYRLGLILAHQELRQLERDREVAGAALSNCHTRVVFRVGDADARSLESGFATFDARDIQNLETGQAICRIEKANHDFNLSVPKPNDPDPAVAAATRQAVIAASRKRYATPRADVEAALLAKMNAEDKQPAKTKPIPKPAEATPVPQPAEVPKPTGSEKESVPAKAREPEAEPAKPHDFGRGGAEHQAIQKRLRLVAEELGYLATIEKSVLDGQGSVDLALEKEGVRIACEVTVTTPVAHEMENIQKCLKAGFTHVAVIATKPDRLTRIREAVEAALPATEQARVGYYSPDEFETYLRQLASVEKSVSAPPSPTGPKEKVIKGIKVRFHAPPLTDNERMAKESVAIQQMQEVMKRQSLPRQQKDRPDHPK